MVFVGCSMVFCGVCWVFSTVVFQWCMLLLGILCVACSHYNKVNDPHKVRKGWVQSLPLVCRGKNGVLGTHLLAKQKSRLGVCRRLTQQLFADPEAPSGAKGIHQ